MCCFYSAGCYLKQLVVALTFDRKLTPNHMSAQSVAKQSAASDSVPPRSQPASAPVAPAEAGDMAFVPTAGPGVRAILAADPSFDVARFLEGAKAA